MDNTSTIFLKCIVGKKLLYIVFIVFFFPEIFRLFQNKNNYLKKKIQIFLIATQLWGDMSYMATQSD